MDKALLNIKYLILLFLMLTNMHSHSQELFKKEFNWESPDSIERNIFNDKEQIIEWCKTQLPFSTAYPKDLIIIDYNICIVMVAGCSGLPCWNIYIFKEEDKLWQLKIFATQARIKEQIKIEVDNKEEKVIFITESGQIGEVPFETLK